MNKHKRDPRYVIALDGLTSGDVESYPKLPKPRTSPFKMDAESALLLLRKDGIVKYIEPVEKGAIAAFPMEGIGWGEVARRLSFLVGGQVWAGCNSMTHNPGGKDPLITYVFPRSVTDDIVSSRKIVAELLSSEENCPIAEKLLRTKSWSISGNARKLIGWTGLEQPYESNCELFMKGLQHHYYHCEPGTLSNAHLFDVSSYYYTLICKLPTPYVIINADGNPVFQRAPDKGMLRWRKMLARIKEHKKLRNIMIGCLSSTGSGSMFINGREKPGPNKKGILRAAALLVIRTAYELCYRAQQETKAVYSNTDCVITQSDFAPTVWKHLGFKVNLESVGDAEIYSIGNYRVGKKETRWYFYGNRDTQYHNGAEPGVLTILKGSRFTDWIEEVGDADEDIRGTR